MEAEVIAAKKIAAPKSVNARESCPAACKPYPRIAPMPAITMNIKTGTELVVLM
jgi:hypothetical protein